MAGKKKFCVPVILITVFLQFTVPFSVSGQSEKKYLRQGNSKYFDGNFSESEVLYRKAIEKNRSSVAGNFNLGDALYRQNKFDEASKQFITSAELGADRIRKAESYYNLGNSLLKNNKIEESIEAYKNSLRLNPSSIEAKYNLAYAQDLLKKMQQQQQQQQQTADENKQNEEQQQQQQQQQQKQGISKEDAERILSALENDEKKVQEKVKQANALRERVKTLKNW